MKSTFYSDGFRDAQERREPSPPDVTVYAFEYFDGYRDASATHQPKQQTLHWEARIEEKAE